MSKEQDKQEVECDTITNSRRWGRFKVSGALIHTMDIRRLKDFTCHFFILRAEHNFMTDTFDYEAYSELFDKMEIGESIPDYKIQITKEEGGDITVKAVRL